MRLLLGIGGGDDSMRALEATVERARETGDELTVAVIENPDAARSTDELVERARARLDEAGVSAEIRTLEAGDQPGASLVELAETGGFDRLVLGGGEASPLGKIRLGPITEFVVLNATTTVTLVR
ncbi:MAG: universal stress protein [Haloarculaceae archaeon]